MPQLDTVTFFSQFFWLSFFFFGFYFALVIVYLPKLSKIFKVRTLKISGNVETLDIRNDDLFNKINTNTKNVISLQSILHNPKEETVTTVRNSIDSLVINAIIDSKTLCTQSFENSTVWLKNVLELTNKNQLQNLNELYYSTIGTFQISQSILLYQLKAIAAPKSYSISGLNKLFPNKTFSQEKVYTLFVLENIMK